MGRRQILNNIVNTVIDLIKKDAPVNKVAADIPPNGLLNDAHVQTKIMDGPAEGYIYNILDTKNGKNYVGSKLGAIDKTEDYLGSGTIIKRIANKRPDDLYKTILGKTSTRREMMTQEEAWLKAYRAAQDDNMYNLKNSYRGATGRIMTDSHKSKISNSVKIDHAKNPRPGGNIGRKFSPEARANMSKAHIGKSPGNKGKKASLETRRKQSEAHKGQTSHNKGKKMSDEQKLKISETLKKRNKGLL